MSESPNIIRLREAVEAAGKKMSAGREEYRIATLALHDALKNESDIRVGDIIRSTKDNKLYRIDWIWVDLGKVVVRGSRQLKGGGFAKHTTDLGASWKRVTAPEPAP
jgi:hypothetical protein